MPKKIRELKAMLIKAGWTQIRGGKGSHSKWSHPLVPRKLIMSGNDGDDAGRAQEKDVESAVQQASGRG